MSRIVYPWVLALLGIVPFLIVIYAQRRDQQPAVRHSRMHRLQSLRPPSFWARVAWLPFASRLVALAALIIALSRPQLGARGFEVSTEGVDIMLVVDVSSSMLAQDFKPNNRLYVAKQVVADFVKRRERDRMGMIVFARQALTKTPLTLDHDILLTHLEDVRIGAVPDGTAIGNAVASGVNRLKESDAESRIMILLTDGVNRDGEIDPITAARLAKTYGIKVYTVGAGKEGMAPYPFSDPIHGTVYQNVRVEIDEETLQMIAAETGAQFFRATDADSLKRVYDEIDALETTEIEQVQYVRYSELAPLLMGLGLALLLLESVASRTRLARFP